MSKNSRRKNRQERRKNQKVQGPAKRNPETKKAIVEARTNEAKPPRMPASFQLPKLHLPSRKTLYGFLGVLVSCAVVSLIAMNKGYNDPSTLLTIVYLWLLFVVAPGFGAYRLAKDSLEAQKTTSAT